MLNTETQAKRAEAAALKVQCRSCRHSVDVRGMEEVVCLAHLMVRHPAHDGTCADFEPKKAVDFGT